MNVNRTNTSTAQFLISSFFQFASIRIQQFSTSSQIQTSAGVRSCQQTMFKVLQLCETSMFVAIAYNSTSTRFSSIFIKSNRFKFNFDPVNFFENYRLQCFGNLPLVALSLSLNAIRNSIRFRILKNHD